MIPGEKEKIMRDRTSEPTRERMPTFNVVSVNAGPNREIRRHSPPPLKEGESYKKNIPYVTKGK